MNSTKKRLKSIKNSAWEEKYRPITLRQVLLPKKTKDALQSYLDEDLVPNLIFHSRTPGTGKTTTAIALANTINAEMKFIKASEDGNKDIVRTDINQFSSTMSMEGKPKVVILDEADGKGGLAFQEAMKGAIESNSHTTKFIFTCNNYENIIGPLKSRCISIKFDDVSKEEMIPLIRERLEIIAKTETSISNGTYEISTIDQIIDRSYPDVRDMIKQMQFVFISNGGNIVGSIDSEKSDVSDRIANMILEKDFHGARKEFRENVRDVQNFIIELGYSLYEKTPPKYHLIIGSILADAARWDTMSVNPEVNVAWGAFSPIIDKLKDL